MDGWRSPRLFQKHPPPLLQTAARRMSPRSNDHGPLGKTDRQNHQTAAAGQLRPEASHREREVQKQKAKYKP